MTQSRMTRVLRRILSNHAFVAVGMFTLALYFGAAALPESGLRAMLISTARVLIVPMYAASLAATAVAHILGSASITTRWVAEAIAVVELAAGIVPYAVADALLRRWRVSRQGERSGDR